jgi:cation diffusion facilitator family transporter
MEQQQRRTAIVSIAAAAVLVALKLGTGLATGSLALVSAGIESSGDVVAAVITFLAIRLGARPADTDHPYGHRRVENLAALGEATIIAGGALLITYEAVARLVAGSGVEVEATPPIFAVIGVAIAIDVSRILVSLRAARRWKSAAFRSNAVNFGGDLAGSLAVLVGLVLVAAGIEQGDAIAALVVAGLIFVAVVRLVRDNAQVLMDRSPEEARVAAEAAVRGLDDLELRGLRLRESAGRYFADVTVAVAPGAPVVEGHEHADRVERTLRRALPNSDIVVHVEPRSHGLSLRQQILAAALTEPLVQEVHDVAVFTHDGRATVSLHLKFDPDLPLEAAHLAADRVERAIGELEHVSEVQTHLEPLEEPVVERGGDPGDLRARERQARLEVERHTGRSPHAVRVLATDAGPVLFLTLGLPDEPALAEAHTLAGELEGRLRADQPDLVEVVVHTEPG